MFSAAAADAAFYAAGGKMDITPDFKRHKVYLAGYGDRGRKPAGIHDKIYARGVLLSDGKKTVGLVALDLIGFFQQDVEEVRKLLAYDPGKQYLLIAATHNHSGPDTLGFWGRFPGLSGVDASYQAYVRSQIAALLRELATQLQEAEMVSGKKNLNMKGLARDSRDPVVMDPEMTAVRILSKRGQKTIATIVNWSCHPEVLQRDNTLLTADFPGQLCDGVEGRLGGTCVYFSGSVGGLVFPDNEALKGVGEDDFAASEKLGEILTEQVNSLVGGPRKGTAPSTVEWSFKSLRLRVENSRYLVFLPKLTFGHAVSNGKGEVLSRWKVWLLSLRHAVFRLKTEELPWITTEVSRIRFGPVEILGIPGELFPELAIGGYDGRFRFGYPLLSPLNSAPPELNRAPRPPYLKDSMKGPFRMLIGLANDELGYIVPEYDFKIAPTLLVEPRPPGHHYEETHCVSPDAAGSIVQAAQDLLNGRR
ncbi:MAG: neutral/alkaline non-lysosomal ceramidase N-terminal domain-containing protein [Elusimicrobia bacterium]|nr:neutral/alkaline non-lysosomal ceramidase N-terminal domain-containing protein [Elusimicrobiota bacterium]